jgi:glycosyltransferase involved in cell wall biosynthesis
MILFLLDYYLPGYRAGGPMRSVYAAVARLRGEHRFAVVTRDRDLGDAAAYPGVGRAPVELDGAEVHYLAPGRRGPVEMRRLAHALRPTLICLNSLFSPVFTLQPLLLRALGLLPRVPVVLAPLGELSPGALAIKPRRKRAYMALARGLGLLRGVTFKASNDEEAEYIRRWFGAGRPVVVARDLVAPAAPPAPVRREKVPGRLRVVFLSRISPKKNLDGALELLRGMEGEVEMDVYGPVGDAAYMARCQAAAERVGPGVHVRFMGPIPQEQVGEALSRYHLFFLPTHGENFGHVVLEALVAGCPLLLSDTTPWRGLETLDVGWDLPLADPAAFRQALERMRAMGQDEFDAFSARAAAYGASAAEDTGALEAHRALFALARGTARR